jgi:uncharacterized membrane protein YfcA
VVLMWTHVLKGTLVPFAAGAALGAAGGAQLFVVLPAATLQGILGLFILTVTWLPRLGTVGSLRNRFAAVGFVATFAGMFVSATGTLVAPFVAHASPTRYNHVATVAALMASMHVIKLVAFGLLGVGFGAHLPLVAAMICCGAAGSWVGRETLGVIREQSFRTVFRLVLTGLALRLLWMAARGMGWF